jgi:Family of unknown function (DUF6338)
VSPPTGTAILILGVFVLPGFVTLLMRERMFAVRGEDTQFERLLNALYYSALIYALLIGAALALGSHKSDVVDLYHGRKTLGEDVGLGVLAALVLPLLIAAVGLRWRKSVTVRPRMLGALGISTAHAVSSAWNEAFSREGRMNEMMIRATLKDGRVVGGYFAHGSLAGYSEHKQDLFIVERWSLDDDGWFAERAPGTAGVWLSHEEIASVEFYDRATE